MRNDRFRSKEEEEEQDTLDWCLTFKHTSLMSVRLEAFHSFIHLTFEKNSEIVTYLVRQRKGRHKFYSSCPYINTLLCSESLVTMGLI